MLALTDAYRARAGVTDVNPAITEERERLERRAEFGVEQIASEVFEVQRRERTEVVVGHHPRVICLRTTIGDAPTCCGLSRGRGDVDRDSGAVATRVMTARSSRPAPH